MGAGANVLLVDDNPSIRELLFVALSPLANVQATGTALEALRWAEKQPPDLIVCDYRMPGLNGLELLAEFGIVCPRARVVMLASRADIEGPLEIAAARVEEFIKKPFFVEDATARIKRVLDRIIAGNAAAEGAGAASVRGTLAQMSVVDLLQTLENGRKSCRLVLTHDGERCVMEFQGGQLVHATLGNLTGEAAVYPVVGWNEGAFLMDFESGECPRTVTHSTQSVLLEGLRRFDESQRDLESAKHSPQSSHATSFAQVASACGF
jgi:DNA-binding NarL/FixJ family response regulator